MAVIYGGCHVNARARARARAQTHSSEFSPQAAVLQVRRLITSIKVAAVSYAQTPVHLLSFALTSTGLFFLKINVRIDLINNY